MKSCSQCQKEVAADAPGGLCPVCVLKGASESHMVAGGPPVSEIQAAFPEFKIVDCIGRGGMGIVYRAEEVDGGRAVALKVLDPSFNDEADFAERFEREARMLGELKHPNIVSIYDFGKSENFFWLTMELVDGVNLRQAMQTEGFTPEQALEIVPALCSALQYAHENGVCHRDVKPENILLGTSGVVKVADFGIARMVGEKAEFTLTKTGSALGTTAYLAPEQIESPGDVDHRADIYSLGVVFYEMLTGSLPLGRFPAPSDKSGSHPDLDEVVFRALEKERELRFQQASDFSSDLRGMAGKGEDSNVKRRAIPEIFAGMTLFGLGLMLAGAVVSLPLLGTGIALWVTGMVLCWYALRTDSTMLRGQRKLLKLVSMAVPLGFLAILGMVPVLWILSRSSVMTEARSDAKRAESAAMAETRVALLTAEANQTLDQILRTGREGKVEELKTFFSEELADDFSNEADFGERLKNGWAKIEFSGVESFNQTVNPPLVSAWMQRGGEKFWLVMSHDGESWKVVKMPSELLGGQELSLEESVVLVVSAAERRDEKVFRLYLMPDLLAMIGDNHEGLQEAMKDFSQMKFAQFEIQPVDTGGLVEVRSLENRSMEIHFRFHENRWKLDLPRELKEKHGAGKEKAGNPVDDSPSMQEFDSENLANESVEAVTPAFTAILDTAESGDEEAFRKYLEPAFSALIEKKDGNLKKLMGEFAKLKSTGARLYGFKGEFEEVRVLPVETGYEIFLRRQGELWLLDTLKPGIGTSGSRKPLDSSEENVNSEQGEDQH